MEWKGHVQWIQQECHVKWSFFRQLSATTRFNRVWRFWYDETSKTCSNRLLCCRHHSMACDSQTLTIAIGDASMLSQSLTVFHVLSASYATLCVKLNHVSKLYHLLSVSYTICCLYHLLSVSYATCCLWTHDATYCVWATLSAVNELYHLLSVSYKDHLRQYTDVTDRRQLSLFHLNIKSLSKHHDEQDTYLNSLEYKFAFTKLTETHWQNFNFVFGLPLPSHVSWRW